MQVALPYLKETKGNIINFASRAGINGDVNQASYAVAKEAIRGITRVAVFLDIEDSAYITGQTIMVDGGSIKLR